RRARCCDRRELARQGAPGGAHTGRHPRAPQPPRRDRILGVSTPGKLGRELRELGAAAAIRHNTASPLLSSRPPMLALANRMSLLGTETAFEVLARAKALEAEGRSIINLGIGQPDFPTPQHIVEAGRKALADGHHGYTPANGILPLREAVVADLHRRYKVEVSPAKVLVVPGGKVTMFFAILMFGEAGAEILYPNPGFPIYESVIRFSGPTPRPIELHESRGFSFSAEEVLTKLTPKTRLLIV